MAIELAPIDVAAGPMAMEFDPVAVESARLEFVRKYLIPAPFASALRMLTLLFVVERPVESDATPLALVLMPVEADVEKKATPEFVEDSPVESEVSLLWAVLRPVEADVESAPT
jgi:hypothetical protein